MSTQLNNSTNVEGLHVSPSLANAMLAVVFFRLQILNNNNKMENKYWGVSLTKIEELKWEKWKADRNNCPAFNTISQTQRVEILNNFLKSIR